MDEDKFSKEVDCLMRMKRQNQNIVRFVGYCSHTGIYFNYEGKIVIADVRQRSFMFFNPEPVKIIPRLLERVEKPEKTLTEADISTRPLWHTYSGSRPPITNTATAEPQPRISSFGRGRWRAIAETQQWSGNNGRGFHGPDTAQSRGSSGANTFWPGGRACAGRGQYGGAVQRQQTAWRPVGSWARGGGGENGRGHGGSGQPRAW